MDESRICRKCGGEACCRACCRIRKGRPAVVPQDPPGSLVLLANQEVVQQHDDLAWKVQTGEIPREHYRLRDLRDEIEIRCEEHGGFVAKVRHPRDARLKSWTFTWDHRNGTFRRRPSYKHAAADSTARPLQGGIRVIVVPSHLRYKYEETTIGQAP